MGRKPTTNWFGRPRRRLPARCITSLGSTRTTWDFGPSAPITRAITTPKGKSSLASASPNPANSTYVRPGGADSPSPAKPALATRDDAAMRRWRANRFGLFIHWGLYSVAGGQWQGKEVPGADAAWIQNMQHSRGGICQVGAAVQSNEVRSQSMGSHGPGMGVRYVTITTKHREGFCLWDSQFTDFNMTATPYGRDLLGPLVKALTAEGVDVHFYYSIIDWHHPDYRVAILSSDDRRAFDRYFEFMKNQLRELLTRYPEVGTLWFDGQWERLLLREPGICRTAGTVSAEGQTRHHHQQPHRCRVERKHRLRCRGTPFRRLQRGF